MRRTAATATSCLALAGLTVLAGCTTEPAPAPSPTPTVTDPADLAVDPDAEALEEIMVEFRATITALRTELEAAAAGDADALASAADLLAADVDGVTSPGGPADGAEPADGASLPTIDPSEPAPVLPGPLVSREESIPYGDLLTRTLAAARSAGSDGAPVLRFLADPLAGDLGAWQRAPDDQLETIADAGAAPDLAAAETAVLALAGEAPRALAWVVHGLTVPTNASDAADRALAHLAIIELSLDQLP